MAFACVIAMAACESRSRLPLSPTPDEGRSLADGNAAQQRLPVSSGSDYHEPPAPPEAPPLEISEVRPASGPTTGGTAIAISGHAFVYGATVSLGDSTAVDVTVVNSTSVTAVTPPGLEGRVDVVVNNPTGESAMLPGGFTYTSDSSPPSSLSVREISPAAGPTAGGTTVRIVGSGFLEGTSVTFGDTRGDEVVVLDGEAIAARTPARSAGAVDVIVTNPDGQSGTLTGGFTYTDETSAGTTITITSSGVAPKEIQTPVGSRVTFVNRDSRSHEMMSDPHPEHTDCPEINAIGFIQPGQTKETDVFRTAFACGFHDHNRDFDENLKGRIVIR